MLGGLIKWHYIPECIEVKKMLQNTSQVVSLVVYMLALMLVQFILDVMLF
jgi:hypothetical protein